MFFENSLFKIYAKLLVRTVEKLNAIYLSKNILKMNFSLLCFKIKKIFLEPNVP